MAPEEKPYRVYKGGRAKGKVPAPPRPERAKRSGGRKAAAADGGNGASARGARRPPRPRRRRRIWLRLLLTLLALAIVWVVAWGAAGYFALRSGVADANSRIGASTRAQLDAAKGQSRTILLLGTDHASFGGRSDAQRTDSIMLVRVDGGKHRIAYLSIPRDLYVDIPGYGRQKINAAYQLGGAPLALRTVKAVTGLPVDHVAMVDFGNFRSLIDAIGGVTVKNPAAILSNRFDCPFKTDAQCRQWEGWRFPKGTLHLDGRQALIYSRVRENRLNPSESDVTRAERQQDVMRAVTSKLTSPTTFLRLPFTGGSLLEPLATDISTGEFLKLAWWKFRTPAKRTIHCRLGGEGSWAGGQSVILPDELNRSVVAMFAGQSAPQPPPPGSGQYGPGCVVGAARLTAR